MVKLLVVDDSKVVTNLVKKYLEGQDLDLAILHSGEEAITFLEDTTVDLILLDVVMGGITGFETMEKIKLLEHAKNIPVMFITSMDRGDDINKGLTLGAVDYILKPFTKSELQDKIQSAISKL